MMDHELVGGPHDGMVFSGPLKDGKMEIAAITPNLSGQMVVRTAFYELEDGKLMFQKSTVEKVDGNKAIKKKDPGGEEPPEKA